MQKLAALLLVLTACTSTQPPAPQPRAAAAPSATRSDAIADHTAKLERIDGFVPLYWDAENGKLLMEIDRLGEEMIYQTSLAAGVGSNPIGLDRNGLGQTHIVRFDRVGPRLRMVEPNYRFRALSSDPMERRAVEESFAQSVLAGFKVEAASDRGVLVDATDFFLSDMDGVAGQLRRTQQGSYSVDRNRSAIYLPRTKAFPRNTEVEATLTFVTGDRPGELIRGVAPDPEAVTVREHHSLVALPEPGFAAPVRSARGD
jgi:Domain of unknown function (DUF5117)